MKKLFCMLLALLMYAPAMAETPAALPVRILEHEEVTVPMSEAMTKAQQLVHPDIQTDKVVRATPVELSDGKKAWVVTTFDIARLIYAWTTLVDAENGDVLYTEVSDEGYLVSVLEAWTEQKGPHALWSMDDKQLYDALYAMLPSYGLPMPGDLSAEDALTKALAALGMDDAAGYDVGYGYLMGGEGYNGVWEICLVIDDQVIYRVNLDAVNGEVYYMETNLQDADEANG